MSLQFFAGISGLLNVLAVPITVAIPYILRRSPAPRSDTEASARSSSFLARMRPHFWIGYLIIGLSVIHALIAMTGITSLVSPIGLSFAYIGLFVVAFQLALGSLLARPDLPQRRTIRKVHFWTMITFVVLGLGHILLNSPTLAHLAR